MNVNKKDIAHISKIVRVATFWFFVLASLSTVTKADPWPPDDLAFILGEWEATDIPDNRFRMSVDWDESNNEFSGYLTKNGKKSFSAGFKVGEHIWTAKLMEDGSLVEYGKWRSGRQGVSTGFEWRSGKVYLDRSSLNILIGDYTRFKRVRSNNVR